MGDDLGVFFVLATAAPGIIHFVLFIISIVLTAKC